MLYSSTFWKLCIVRVVITFLSLCLGANDNANETPDICPMEGLTRGKKLIALKIRTGHQSKTGQKCRMNGSDFLQQIIHILNLIAQFDDVSP